MTKLRYLSLGEHAIIGDIIADSFADDPMALWVFGGQSGIQHYITKIAQKHYLQKGNGYVMDDQSGGSLWLPPGIKKKLPLIKSIDIVVPMIKHGGLKPIKRGLLVDHALCKVKPETPHYYLFAIGTRSTKQGKGIGGKLMEAGLEKVDLAKLPTYLESSKEINIPFYRRYGFEVIERFVPTRGCPPLWLMWREPQ
ncbi:MAG: GNAT superfamily N-acetyltransferase [Oleiphilaceae bacterium]|jgi:GNAT superfamily N-acetyltransferase